MREILFRGKTDEEKWEYGVPITVVHNCYRKTVEITKSIEIETEFDFSRDIDHEEVIPETIGQYTGLTDKNGTKIFEGDIVKAHITQNAYTHTKKYEGVYEVKYHDKNCYFYLAKQGNNLLFDCNWEYCVSKIEVIGNIHDNPELLKGGAT